MLINTGNISRKVLSKVLRSFDKNFERLQLHKDNLRSYGGRMKNQVTLADFYLLDINDGNKQFLSQFKQGINSNGKPRAPKIMVERDQFKNFAIAEMPLL